MEEEQDIKSYAKCAEVGKRFYKAMDEAPDVPNPSAVCSQSIWNRYQDLEENGWTLTTVYSCEEYLEDDILPEIVKEHKINMQGSNAEVTKWIHNAKPTSRKPPLWYPATKAVYQQIYNVDDGTIFALRNFSPSYQAKEGQKDGKFMGMVIPRDGLQHWADVVYLNWKHYTELPGAREGGEKQILRRIVRHAVQNETAARILNEIEERMKASGFPETKVKLTPDDGDDDFFALLGTPNGTSIGYLLAQHKGEDQLGWLIVESITVWFGDVKAKGVEKDSDMLTRRQGRCMVFEIVENPQVGSKEDTGTVKKEIERN